MKTNPKLGILGVYNQDWAMTRYVDRFLAGFAADEVVVLAENVDPSQLIRADSSHVCRVWHRSSSDYSALADTIALNRVTSLHINCSFPFFDNSDFYDFARGLNSQGVCITAHLHDMNALEAMLPLLREQCAAVVVDNPSSRLVCIAAGIAPEQVEVVESGVEETVYVDRIAAAHQLGINPDHLNVVCFDFGLPEAKIEDLIAAIYQLQAGSREAHLYVVQIDGGTGFEIGYAAGLKRKVESLHLDHFVHFIEDHAADSRLQSYVSAADLVVLSSSRPQFEAREVLGLGLSCGAPIVAATKLAFDGLDGCTFAVSKSFPLLRAIETVAFNPVLAKELGEGATRWASAHGNAATCRLYARIFAQHGGGAFSPLQGSEATSSAPAPELTKMIPAGASAERRQPAENAATTRKVPQVGSGQRPLRILMQNRANSLTHPGGDTIVMQKLAAGMAARGHSVDIDVKREKNPTDYDLVHLYNFAIRDATEQLAKAVYAAGVPYVVTTFYEDWPSFYNQMAGLYFVLNAYVDAGQPKDQWPSLLEAARTVERSAIWDNSWTANHAAALIASGKYEAETLRRDYPQTQRVEIFHCGRDYVAAGDGGERFRRETGLQDFVLCVGRLEWRKNQLMLLKALEDSDLTLVFATGGFTYQKEYEAACRRFRRRGKTVFLGRLDEEMMASAFEAARIHVLPSWHELPGLVSLEAAQHGKNVVVTDYGTARDYFGDSAYYCSPDDDQSILNAVLAAYHAPLKSSLADQVSRFTWEAAVERNLQIYQTVLGREIQPELVSLSPASPAAVPSSPFDPGIENASHRAAQATQTVARIPEVVGAQPNFSSNTDEAVRLCVEGDKLMVRKEPELAREKYEQALGAHSNFARAYRSLGVIELNSGNTQRAETQFKKALRYDPRDIKALLGLGAIHWETGEKEEAFRLYLRAAENDPNSPSAILYLVKAAYELNRLEDLENALRRFLQENRNNLSIQYCLAGCYYRQKKFSRANGIVEHILRLDPNHEEALDLKQRIEEELAKPDSAKAEWSSAGEEDFSFQSPAGAPATARAIPVNVRLSQLEELKRAKDFKEVINGADSILSDPAATGSEKTLAAIIKAEALGCSGDAVAADSLFTKAVADPTYGYRASAGRGAIAASLERWEEAITLFENALAANPNYDPAFAGLGICATGRNQHETAWNYFQKALELNCENTQAIHGTINLGYQLNRLKEAERAIVNFLELHPVDFGFLYSLAGCLFAQGRYAEARSQCQKILLFEPGHQMANELLERMDQEEQKRAAAS